MILADILSFLESQVPLALQEDYDNSGIILGEPGMEISSAIICLDVKEEVILEALECNCNLVISHHPLIFSGLKKITGRNMVERIVLKAIQERIAVVAMHTNLDNFSQGVNQELCSKLGIMNPAVLRPLEGKLRKLATFCPENFAEKVRNALFEAGAGHIGNYDSCSFNSTGKGSFRPLEGSDPFIGTQQELHFEEEVKIEVIYPAFLEKRIINALLSSHPYEEVAYDLYPLANHFKTAGAGMIGELIKPLNPLDYLAEVKEILGLKCLKHTSSQAKLIRKVAVCGGSGSFLIPDAMSAGADLYMTGDIKYHDFFLPENKLLLADIGHYESEQFTKELIFKLIKKKFPTFALQISGRDSNPVKYL